MYVHVIVWLTVTVIRDIRNVLIKTLFLLLFLQAILEQELRPYFDGKWKGLGDPHLSSYGIHFLIRFLCCP